MNISQDQLEDAIEAASRKASRARAALSGTYTKQVVRVPNSAGGGRGGRSGGQARQSGTTKEVNTFVRKSNDVDSTFSFIDELLIRDIDISKVPWAQYPDPFFLGSMKYMTPPPTEDSPPNMFIARDMKLATHNIARYADKLNFLAAGVKGAQESRLKFDVHNNAREEARDVNQEYGNVPPEAQWIDTPIPISMCNNGFYVLGYNTLAAQLKRVAREKTKNLKRQYPPEHGPLPMAVEMKHLLPTKAEESVTTEQSLFASAVLDAQPESKAEANVSS